MSLVTLADQTRANASSLACPGKTPGSKYQFMEDQMLRKRRSLEEKIPELEKTLEAVKFFMSKKVRPPRRPTVTPGNGQTR